MSLADALERAAEAVPEAADAIRPANGQPDRVLAGLEPALAARVLAWLLSQEVAAGAELAEAWAESEAAVGVFAAVDEEGLSKAARKVLRRAQHRLRSRGVAVAERAPEARVARPPGGGEEALEAALVSPVDPSGARLVVIVEPDPQGGARLFEVLIDVRRGVLECQAFSTTRGRARRFAREASERGRLRATPVPVDAARALLARAAARQPADRALPRTFAEWRSRLAVAPEGARTPGEQARETLGTQGSARRAIELIRAREIGVFLPAEAALREVAEKIQEIGKQRIVVSGVRRREQVEELLRGAQEAIFDAAEAERVAEWLEETAWLLGQGGREDDARACVAAAAEARQEQGEVRRAVLEGALAPILTQVREEEREQEASSLLVKP